MKSKRDPNRWVVAEIIKTGNPAAQYPLPVSRQGIRALYELNKAMVVPAYFAEHVGGLPTWSKNSDGQTILDSEEYRFQTEEIDKEYQSIEGIRKFVAECKDDKSDLHAEFGAIKIGVSSIPEHMKKVAKPVEKPAPKVKSPRIDADV